MKCFSFFVLLMLKKKLLKCVRTQTFWVYLHPKNFTVNLTENCKDNQYIYFIFSLLNMFERKYCCRTLTPLVRCSWRHKGIMNHENISCLHAWRRYLFEGIVTTHAKLNPLLKLKKIREAASGHAGFFRPRILIILIIPTIFRVGLFVSRISFGVSEYFYLQLITYHHFALRISFGVSEYLYL